MPLPPLAALPALALPGWRRCLVPLLSCVLMGLAGCGGGGDGDGSAAGEGSGGSAGGAGGGGASGGSGTLVVDASPLRAAVQLDTARAATQTLPIDGGTLAATGADGTVYTLTVPGDALLEPTTITMTPLASVAVAGLATSAGYGVQLEPAGATFSNYLTLTVTPPPGASAPADRQIPIGWSGEHNTVSLVAMDQASGEARLKLLHFSGYALLLATQGTNATLEPARHRLGGDEEARLTSVAAERLLQERQRQLRGLPATPTDQMLDDLFKAFDEKVLKPRIAAAGSSCAAGRLAIQTVLGRSRQRQLLGYPDDDYSHSALYGDIMASATAACTKEEYALCRDEHIITRMLPYYLGVARQAALLGLSTADPAGDPAWLREAEAAVSNCLNFELQFDSDLEKTDGDAVTRHTTREHVSARLPLPFNMGTALYGAGGFYAATTPAPAPLVSSGYATSYPHTCASVAGVTGVDARMLGMLGFEPEAGGVAQRAKVKDFYFTPGAVPNGFGSQYMLTTRTPRQSGCEDPATYAFPENWVIDGYPVILDQHADPTLGAAIRNWQIVGGDILATKDFSARLAEDQKTVTVQTRLVLFHKPAP